MVTTVPSTPRRNGSPVSDPDDARPWQNPFDPDEVVGPAGDSPEGPSELPDLGDRMARHAEDAVEHARTTFGVELDGTRDSIELLEMIGYTIHRLLAEEGEQLSDPEFDTLCTIYGGYLGEVIRKTLGGDWEYDLLAQPGSALISLRLEQGRVFPPMKWARRIEKGNDEDLRVFFEKIANAGKPPRSE